MADEVDQRQDRAGGGHEEAASARLPAAIEAVLVVADNAVTALTLAEVLGESPELVGGALADLERDYVDHGRGIRLREGPSGWRLYAAPEYEDIVRRAVLDAAPTRLTAAALETLAVVAYQQPVSRGRVAAVRGVNVDAVIRTLVARGLVTEVGQDGPSGALLYGTTELFLEKIGLRSLDELPQLAPLLPDPEVFEVADDIRSGGA